MDCKFVVGQRVVCVDDSTDQGKRWYPGTALKKGDVYTIKAIFAFSGTNNIGVVLREVENWLSYQGGYKACRFRPVDESRLNIFRAMLAPIREREHA